MLIARGAAVLTGLCLWFRLSHTGTRIKAMVGNRELAEAVGIPVHRLAAHTFIVGICLAGLAGVHDRAADAGAALHGPGLHAELVLRAGGRRARQRRGLLTGAVAIGGIDSVVSAIIDGTAGYLTVLVMAILFLWLGPRGLFARVASRSWR